MSKIDKQINALIAKYSDKMSKDFIAAIRSITDSIIIKDLEKAIRENNVKKIIEITGVNKAAFRSVELNIAQSFEEGGIDVAASIPKNLVDSNGVRGVFRFDIRNPRAEKWLLSQSSEFVTRTTTSTTDAIRNALQAGLIRGDNPNTVALDLAGRLGSNGKRTGGIIGLSKQQETWLRSAQAEIAGKDVKELKNYLTRKMRDKRFDSIVERAIQNGERIPVKKQQQIVSRMNDNLLRLRGQTIARTEMLESLNRSQWETYNQAIDKGKMNNEMIKKKWDDSGFDVRDSHVILDSQEPIDLNRAFISPTTGKSMMFPTDKSMGAKGEDVINCRCRVRYIVDFFANVK